MKKGKRLSFHITLSEETKELFEKFCEQKAINKSRLVEWILIKHIENNV